MDLKITARRAPVRYELFTEGVHLGVFEVKDKWEGMLKLFNPDNAQTVIITQPDNDTGFATLFNDIFNPNAAQPPAEVDVLKASPSFVAKAMPKPAPNEEVPGEEVRDVVR